MKRGMKERSDKEMTDRILQDTCSQTSTLETTWQSSTQAYGVMFTVQSKNDPVQILTIEFSAVRIADAEVEVFVYTKPGDYRGFENKPSAWEKVADAKLVPAQNSGTVIPRQNFSPVDMQEDELRAFYVTLSTTDLKYANSEVATGTEYATDSYLAVNVGAGVLDFPFSDFLFEPRLFTGRLHYSRQVNCDGILIQTSVNYVFLVEHRIDELSSRVISLVNSGVEASMFKSLQSDTVLFAYVSDYKLSLQSTRSSVASNVPTVGYSGCATTGDRRCTAIQTILTFKHMDSLSSGAIQYNFLSRSNEVVQRLNEGSLKVIYGGESASQATLLVTLDGIPFRQEMDELQRQYFEDTTRDFLKQYDSVDAATSILVLNVIDQDAYQSGSTSAVDLTTVISGSVKSQSESDLGEIAASLIQRHNYEYLADIVGISQQILGDPRASYFSGVSTASAIVLGSNSSNTSSNGGRNGGVVAAVVLSIILVILIGVIAVWCRRRATWDTDDSNSKESEGVGSEKGDYAADVFKREQSHRIQPMHPIVYAQPLQGNPDVPPHMQVRADLHSIYSMMEGSGLQGSGFDEMGHNYDEDDYSLPNRSPMYSVEDAFHGQMTMDPRYPPHSPGRRSFPNSSSLHYPQSPYPASVYDERAYSTRGSRMRHQDHPKDFVWHYSGGARAPGRRTPEEGHGARSMRSRSSARSPYRQTPTSMHPRRYNHDPRSALSPFIPLAQSESDANQNESPRHRKAIRGTPHPPRPRSQSRERVLKTPTKSERTPTSDRSPDEQHSPNQSDPKQSEPKTPRFTKKTYQSPAPDRSAARGERVRARRAAVESQKQSRRNIQEESESSSSVESSSSSESEGPSVPPLQRRLQIPLQINTEPMEGPIVTDDGAPLNLQHGTQANRSVSPITLGTFGSGPSGSIAVISTGMTKSTVSSLTPHRE